MAPSFNLAAAIALSLFTSSLVSAAPTTNGPRSTSQGHKISIPQIQNPNFNKTAGGLMGPSAYKYALSKYAKHVPSGVPVNENVLVSTPPPSLKGSVVANDPYYGYDREYLCQVNIGNPAQGLPLDFDTGSSDLWVFSTETPSSQVTSGKPIYNPKASKNSTLIPGATWSISYGDSSSSGGDVYKDIVSLGGLTVKSQAVESAQHASTTFVQDGASSGLLGLAFSTINQVRPTPQNTWFDNIKSSLAAPLFTANLNVQAPGTYNFGYIDTTSYTGNINYVGVNPWSYGLWQFATSGFGIGSAKFNSTPISAIADTGTTLLLLPQSIVAAYYAALPNSFYTTQLGAYIYPCSQTPPSFTFGIGSARQVIPGSYMNYGQVGSGYCYGGIQSQGNLPFSIFGDIALKAQFVVFDMGNLRLGWAGKGAK